MAAVPPNGLYGSMLGMALTNPVLYSQMAWAQALGPRSVQTWAIRRALFSDDLPDDEVRGYFNQFQPESSMVILDLLSLDLPPSLPCLDLPILVLGTEKDGFVFSAALEATARIYRTRPEVFPDMAHAMMLDHRWETVARRILDWLAVTLGDETGR